MADYGAIRDGLKTRLETLTDLAVVFDTFPDRVIVPAAVVIPGSTVAAYHQSGNDAGQLQTFTFHIEVLVPRWEPHSAQDALDAYISGNASVEYAIRGDKTLAGNAFDSQVVRCFDYGGRVVADSEYLGATFEVEVIA